MNKAAAGATIALCVVVLLDAWRITLWNWSNLRLMNDVTRAAVLPATIPALLEWPTSLEAAAAAPEIRGNPRAGDRLAAVALTLAGDLQQAARRLDAVALRAPSDAAVQLGRARLRSRANDPVAAAPAYDRATALLEAVDAVGQTAYAMTTREAARLEYVRAGHALAVRRDERAGEFLARARAAFPRNLVSVADEAVLADASGAGGAPVEDLVNCRYSLPTAPSLVALLPDVVDRAADKHFVTEDVARRLRDYVQWRNAAAVSRPGTSTRVSEDTTGDLLAAYPFRPDPDTGFPAFWRWDEWSGGRWTDGAFFGGLEWIEEMNLQALRITGVCAEDAHDGRGEAHAGYGLRSPWPEVAAGAVYDLRILYRTDRDDGSVPGLYWAFGRRGDAHPASVLMPKTDGMWREYRTEIAVPNESDGAVYLNLRSLGPGTVWFARIAATRTR